MVTISVSLIDYMDLSAPQAVFLFIDTIFRKKDFANKSVHRCNNTRMCIVLLPQKQTSRFIWLWYYGKVWKICDNGRMIFINTYE